MEWTDLNARVKCAFDALNHYDLLLLQNDAHERTVCARLAMYLQAVFPGYDVDVEYNRHGFDPKRLQEIPNCKNHDSLVYPDVVVHRRGNDDSNLLVMELKKSTNTEPRDCDRTKLKCCVDAFKYDFAVLVDIPVGHGEGGAGCPPDIEWVDGTHDVSDG